MTSTRQGWVLGCCRADPRAGAVSPAAARMVVTCMDTVLPRACLHSCLSSQCCLDVMQMGEVLGWGAGTARSKNPFGTTVG